MRIKKSYEVHSAPDEIIGHFGQVQLVRRPDGRHDLLGGSNGAQVMVRKWCGLFAPFLVFGESYEHEVVLRRSLKSA